MMWGYDGWWWFGLLHMLLYWGVFILVIALLVRWLFGSSPGANWARSDRALDILKERYARGEIDKNEFEQKRRDIQG